MFSLSMISFIIVIFLYTHITCVVFSIYSHRHVSHKLVYYNKTVEHIMKFWLWLTIGVQNQFKTASHQIHHKYTDRVGDPHSVHVDGIYQMCVKRLVSTFKVLALFCNPVHGKDDSWAEKNGVTFKSDYTLIYPRLGRALFLTTNIILFGWSGLLLFFSFYALVIVVLIFGIDVMGHSIGYKNHALNDKSTNFPFLFFLAGGEELQNNHHAAPSKAKFSHKWFEFDSGYFYIWLLEKANLATVKK